MRGSRPIVLMAGGFVVVVAVDEPLPGRVTTVRAGIVVLVVAVRGVVVAVDATVLLVVAWVTRLSRVVRTASGTVEGRESVPHRHVVAVEGLHVSGVVASSDRPAGVPVTLLAVLRQVCHYTPAVFSLDPTHSSDPSVR